MSKEDYKRAKEITPGEMSGYLESLAEAINLKSPSTSFSSLSRFAANNTDYKNIYSELQILSSHIEGKEEFAPFRKDRNIYGRILYSMYILSTQEVYGLGKTRVIVDNLNILGLADSIGHIAATDALGLYHQQKGDLKSAAYNFKKAISTNSKDYYQGDKVKNIAISHLMALPIDLVGSDLISSDNKDNIESCLASTKAKISDYTEGYNYQIMYDELKKLATKIEEEKEGFKTFKDQDIHENIKTMMNSLANDKKYKVNPETPVTWITKAKVSNAAATTDTDIPS